MTEKKILQGQEGEACFFLFVFLAFVLFLLSVEAHEVPN